MHGSPPDEALVIGGGRRAAVRLPRPMAFWSIAAIFLLFLAASSAPSPLYVVYQQAWHFSSTTLTVVFAVYVVGLLGSLLVVGGLSDHLGRRPVLGAAVLLESLALVLFVVAGSVATLIIARVAQGIATGAAMTTLGAALVDLDPPHAPGRAGLVNGVAPITGLAVGAIGCGALVQYGPAPTRLTWLLLLGAMVAAGAVVVALPETSGRRPGGLASLRPRVGVPGRLRAEVLAVLPVLIASWALGGLYLSLGPSIAAALFGLHSHLIGGLVVTLLCGSGAVAALALRTRPLGAVLLAAALLMVLGTIVSLVGVGSASSGVAAVGTVVAGLGFGSASLGCFGTFARIAAPHERGELFAVAYVIAYVAFSLPAVVAGLSATSFGLQATAEVYGVAVVVLGIAALLAQRALDREPAAR